VSRTSVGGGSVKRTCDHLTSPGSGDLIWQKGANPRVDFAATVGQPLAEGRLDQESGLLGDSPGGNVPDLAAPLYELQAERGEGPAADGSRRVCRNTAIGRPFVARTWAVMALARLHTFQVLTKRPRRLAVMLADPGFVRQVGVAATEIIGRTPHGVWRMDMTGWTTESGVEDRVWMPPWPLPNVWVGTSIESDEYTWRADELRRAPAAIRFLSLEPLAGPLPSLHLTSIDWVIVGGESGPDFRPLNMEWVRDLRDRCVSMRIPLFFKQAGGATSKAGGRQLDGRTWDEFPLVCQGRRAAS
jgi:protein gp37